MISDDLDWFATNLRRRAWERDPLSIAEMLQLAAMLANLRDGNGALAPVPPQRGHLTVIQGDRP